MDTIWFGLKLGVGIIVGMGLVRFVWNLAIGQIDARDFHENADARSSTKVEAKRIQTVG